MFQKIALVAIRSKSREETPAIIQGSRDPMTMAQKEVIWTEGEGGWTWGGVWRQQTC